VVSKQETLLTTGATDGLTHGLAEFMAQEEMGRFTGYWWSPDGRKIAYEEADDRHIPAYTIAHMGPDDTSAEVHRYPFPGKANARVRLGVVDVGGGETRWLDIAGPGADFYLGTYETVRTNLGCFVNQGRCPLCSSLHMTSASATRTPLTVARPAILATVPLRLRTVSSMRS